MGFSICQMRRFLSLLSSSNQRRACGKLMVFSVSETVPISPLSGTVYWIEQIIDYAIHNNRPNVQNVRLLFLMAHEYLTAKVTLQKYPQWKSINCFFFF